jgi:hypothetical protein
VGVSNPNGPGVKFGRSNCQKQRGIYALSIHGENVVLYILAKLKQQAREYGIIKKNVDSILNPGTERAKGKDLNAEL